MKREKKCPDDSIADVWEWVGEHNRLCISQDKESSKIRNEMTIAGAWNDRESLVCVIQALAPSYLKFNCIQSLYEKFPKMKDGSWKSEKAQPSPKLKKVLRLIEGYNHTTRKIDTLYRETIDWVKEKGNSVDKRFLEELAGYAEGSLGSPIFDFCRFGKFIL